MEVRLLPDLADDLTALAKQTGRPTHDLVHEAVRAFIDQKRRYMEAVEAGIAAADSGDLVEDEQVLAWLEAQESRERS